MLCGNETKQQTINHRNQQGHPIITSSRLLFKVFSNGLTAYTPKCFYAKRAAILFQAKRASNAYTWFSCAIGWNCHALISICASVILVQRNAKHTHSLGLWALVWMSHFSISVCGFSLSWKRLQSLTMLHCSICAVSSDKTWLLWHVHVLMQGA